MRPVAIALRVVVAAGLATDAWVHADLASGYSHVRGTVNQGQLFLIEAAVASAAALVVLVVTRLWGPAFAFLVAVSALGAVLLYRYVDVGALGPLPNMYEPVWYTEKTVSMVAEAVATVSAAALLIATLRRRAPTGGRDDLGRSSAPLLRSVGSTRARS